MTDDRRGPGRRAAVLPVLAGGAVALIGSTQTWMDVTLRDGAQLAVAVPGASALAVLAPLSLAALALGLALTIAGRVLRYVLAVTAVAIGAVVAVTSWRIATELPVDAIAGAVTEATGLRGAEAVGALASSIVASPWPGVTVGAGAVIVVGGVMALLFAHRWAGSGRRYRAQTGRASGPADPIDSWDDLSRGEDPTR